MAGFPEREVILEKLYSAALSDTLDSMGFTHQAMQPFVQPHDDQLVLFGRARAGVYMDCYSVPTGRNP